MLKNFLLLSALFVFSQAEITLEEINSKPPSHAKNFMIWQYLKQDITPEQADEAFYQLDGVSNKLLKAYAKKSDRKEIKYTLECKKRKDLLSIKQDDCLDLAISPYKTLHMSQKDREKLSKRVSSNYIKDMLKIQSEPYTQKAYEAYKPGIILSAFISTTSSHRRKNLNIYLDKEFINSLTSSWKISQFIKIVINDDKLDKLQKSILNLDGEKLNSQNNFFLALHQLKHSKDEAALKHFELSRSKATQRIDVDKNYFWMYKVTNDKKYLEELSQSHDINMYSLYAYEVMKKEFNNYYSSVDTVNDTATKDIKDPFDWNAILKEIKATPKEKLLELSKEYKQKNMIPVQSLILQKAHNYKKHGFIMPYNKYLDSLSNDEKAFVYAIMRQESNLIPSALSRSYALGLMQLMPFLVDAIAQESKEKIDRYEEMFIPKNNINYALKHLKWMKKSLYHPLFIAYAYNGGMGFFKRHLMKGTFNSGKYEPFLSMELMSNSESREYGKKVLANYVMYKKVLGEKVSIVQLFDTLTQPKKTDRFRAQG